MSQVEQTETESEETPKYRGFASMSPERQREIASRGGKSVHVKGLGHQFTAEEARAAGRIGGQNCSQNKEHMAEIGRRGGTTTGAKKRQKKVEVTE